MMAEQREMIADFELRFHRAMFGEVSAKEIAKLQAEGAPITTAFGVAADSLDWVAIARRRRLVELGSPPATPFSDEMTKLKDGEPWLVPGGLVSQIGDRLPWPAGEPLDEAEEAEDRAYTAGHRQALLRMLRWVLHELGVNDPDTAGARWVSERVELVLRLREICARHGDNDWVDTAHLGDVIEKHLGNYLEES